MRIPGIPPPISLSPARDSAPSASRSAAWVCRRCWCRRAATSWRSWATIWPRSSVGFYRRVDCDALYCERSESLQIPRHLRLVQQAVDLRRVIQRVVRLERQLRRELQPQRMYHVATQERGRAGQRRQQRIDVRTPQPRHEGDGVLQIGPDAHLGYRDLRLGQLRIAEIPPFEHSGEHVANLLRHAQLALRRACSRLPQAGTSSVSKHSMTSPSCRSWKLANDRP